LNWYFPKLGWWASLPLAAYFLGGIKLFLMAFNLEVGTERTEIVVGIYLYLAPFLLFLAVIGVGHGKLMEKREALRLRD